MRDDINYKSSDSDDSGDSIPQSKITQKWSKDFLKGNYFDDQWPPSTEPQPQSLPEPCVSDVLQLIRKTTGEKSVDNGYKNPTAPPNVTEEAIKTILAINPSTIPSSTGPSQTQSNSIAQPSVNGFHHAHPPPSNMGPSNFRPTHPIPPPLRHYQNPPQMQFSHSVLVPPFQPPPMTSIPTANIVQGTIDNTPFPLFPYMQNNPSLPAGAVVGPNLFYAHRAPTHMVGRQPNLLTNNRVTRFSPQNPVQIQSSMSHRMPAASIPYLADPNVPLANRDPRLGPRSPAPSPQQPVAESNRTPVVRTPTSNSRNQFVAAPINRRRISIAAYLAKGKGNECDSPPISDEPAHTSKPVDGSQPTENSDDELAFSPAVSSEHNSSPAYSPAPDVLIENEPENEPEHEVEHQNHDVEEETEEADNVSINYGSAASEGEEESVASDDTAEFNWEEYKQSHLGSNDVSVEHETEAVQIATDVPFPKCEVEVEEQPSDVDSSPSGDSQDTLPFEQDENISLESPEVDTKSQCRLILVDAKVATQTDEQVVAGPSSQMQDELLQPLFIGEEEEEEEEEEDDEEAKSQIDPKSLPGCFVILTRCEDLIRRYVPTYRSMEDPRPVVKPILHPVAQTPARRYSDYSPIEIESSEDELDDNNNANNNVDADVVIILSDSD